MSINFVDRFPKKMENGTKCSENFPQISVKVIDIYSVLTCILYITQNLMVLILESSVWT